MTYAFGDVVDRGHRGSPKRLGFRGRRPEGIHVRERDVGRVPGPDDHRCVPARSRIADAGRDIERAQPVVSRRNAAQEALPLKVGLRPCDQIRRLRELESAAMNLGAALWLKRQSILGSDQSPPGSDRFRRCFADSARCSGGWRRCTPSDSFSYFAGSFTLSGCLELSASENRPTGRRSFSPCRRCRIPARPLCRPLCNLWMKSSPESMTQ